MNSTKIIIRKVKIAGVETMTTLTTEEMTSVVPNHLNKLQALALHLKQMTETQSKIRATREMNSLTTAAENKKIGQSGELERDLKREDSTKSQLKPISRASTT